MTGSIEQENIREQNLQYEGLLMRIEDLSQEIMYLTSKVNKIQDSNERTSFSSTNYSSTGISRSYAIKKNDLKLYLEFFLEHKKNMDGFIDSCPKEISSAFFDNPYTDAHFKLLEKTLELYCGKTLKEEIFRYIYEIHGTGEIITIDGMAIHINTIEDFLNFLLIMKLIEQ